MTFTVEYEREDDGRWLPCASWQIVLSTAKANPNSSASLSLLHEPMVLSESEARSRRAAAHRLES